MNEINSFEIIELYRGIVCLPELTDEGYHIILCKLIDPQSSKFIFNDAVKVLVL